MVNTANVTVMTNYIPIEIPKLGSWRSCPERRRGTGGASSDAV
jgi:hypothetical protein